MGNDMEKFCLCKNCRYLSIEGDTGKCSAPSGQDISMEGSRVNQCTAFEEDGKATGDKKWNRFILGFIGDMEVIGK